MDESVDMGRASGQGWAVGEVRPASCGWMRGGCLEILYEDLRDLSEEKAVKVEDDGCCDGGGGDGRLALSMTMANWRRKW
jgi:hypothetical protein